VPYGKAIWIDKKIRWEQIDLTTVKAWYTNQGIGISASLNFKQNRELVKFISNDSYDLSDPKSPKLYPFATPIVSHKDYNGFCRYRMQKPLTTGPRETLVMETLFSIQLNVIAMNKIV